MFFHIIANKRINKNRNIEFTQLIYKMLYSTYVNLQKVLDFFTFDQFIFVGVFIMFRSCPPSNVSSSTWGRSKARVYLHLKKEKNPFDVRTLPYVDQPAERDKLANNFPHSLSVPVHIVLRSRSQSSRYYFGKRTTKRFYHFLFFSPKIKKYNF